MMKKNHSVALSQTINLSVLEFYPPKTEINQLQTIILLNSSFFNQNQWNNGLKVLFSLLPENHHFRFITYDYSGVGGSDYENAKISIDNFMDEFFSILTYFDLQKVHVFGMSIGSWIALNLTAKYPQRIRSFVGYGNLAPYLPNFQLMRQKRFESIKESFVSIKTLSSHSIDENNWLTLFNQFYIPVFFDHIKSDNSENSFNNARRILAKIVYPMVKGNKMALIPDYYDYIVNTMVKEGNELLPLLTQISPLIPVMFLNGEIDPIAPPLMSSDLHSKIKHSKLEILPKLGHGSVILGKGNKKIMELYLEFIQNL
ncbi:Putative aminoacrylate hydrolase RutD [Candidatus Lokiarchaeum ossiferum]|uniref:Aminoacrylate hydrolase RutD n=1 Tax=Candidatus Lokiarchaeum ossiferum TaxID=2951803 RepID=A0ABY6HUY1_9ARCH|nr:Putative aminoacrylate hydrolase RutD [Candidatus Lokiarchaeum sp. B-35]